MRNSKMKNNIRIFVMDVDGTLTDGKIYIGSDGELMKAFDIKDGYAIHDLLPRYGMIPVIITGRSSQIVKRRADELGISELYQGKHDKIETMNNIVSKYGLSLSNCAYIGDDVLDLPCMLAIREAGGITGCPCDAVDEVKAASDFVSSKEGGRGAVREFVEYLSKASE